MQEDICVMENNHEHGKEDDIYEECKACNCSNTAEGRQSTVETDLSTGFDAEPHTTITNKDEPLAHQNRLFSEEEYRQLLSDPYLSTHDVHDRYEPVREKLVVPSCLTEKNWSFQDPLKSPSIFPMSAMSSRSSKLLSRRGANL